MKKINSGAWEVLKFWIWAESTHWLKVNCNFHILSKTNYILLPNPAMSSTPMKLEEVLKGKHWFTRLTTWSKRQLYTALARASRALFACSTFRGTLGRHTKWGSERHPKLEHSRLLLNLFCIFSINPIFTWQQKFSCVSLCWIVLFSFWLMLKLP